MSNQNIIRKRLTRNQWISLRRLILIVLILLNFQDLALSQNYQAKISNLSAVDDTIKNEIVIRYDLSDIELEDIEISLRVSNDNGQSYLHHSKEVTGDVGFPVKAGTGKMIVWKYNDSIKHDFKIKLIADDRYKIDIQELLKQVDTIRIKNTVKNVYGERNHRNKKTSTHLARVRSYIWNEYNNANLITKRQVYSLKDFTIENVLGRKDGAYDNHIVYVLGAHIDTAPKSPGADDNGSGVAGMIEAMRILSKYNFKRSIEFVAFDKEEVGFLGSQLYLTSDVPHFKKIDGAFNFDMIGFCTDKPNTQTVPDAFEILFPEAVNFVKENDYRGNFVICTSNEPSEFLSETFARNANSHVPELNVVQLMSLAKAEFTRNLILSDHSMFWNAGLKAVHIGDGGETRNTNIDSGNDRMEDLNYVFIKNIVRATIASIAELAQLNHSSVEYSDVTLK